MVVPARNPTGVVEPQGQRCRDGVPGLAPSAQSWMDTGLWVPHGGATCKSDSDRSERGLNVVDSGDVDHGLEDMRLTWMAGGKGDGERVLMSEGHPAELEASFGLPPRTVRSQEVGLGSV